jgi:hypothetical protein
MLAVRIRVGARTATARAVLAVLASVALSGCTVLGRGDGRTAGAGVTTARAGPVVGTCYLLLTHVSYPSFETPVGCEHVHEAETVSVGQFGDQAEAATAPAAGSRAHRAAFDACDTAGKAYVGGDWRGARLSLRVVVPAPQLWAGGARWYRCDLFELVTVDGSTGQEYAYDHGADRTGTLRDALTRKLPMVFACFNKDTWGHLQHVACGKPHRYEYAGVWTAPDLTYEDLADQKERIHRHCWAVIATFLDLPDRLNVRQYTGVEYRLPGPEVWQRGDRGVRCFLWAQDGDHTGSLQGIGVRMQPV